ncbi:helix-turn-helix domain-containing protein [Streptococcus suis]|nr:helix-turn-helix domain-containing protein [Streptococcus suis]
MMKTTTSQRLKQILSERNLRQVDILNRSLPFQKELGVKMGKSALSQYVSGKSSPDQDKLVLLSKTLGVSEAWLMGYDVPMSDNREEQELLSKISEKSSGLTVDNQKIILTTIENILAKQSDKAEKKSEYNSNKVVKLSDYKEYRSEKLSGILSAGRGIWQEEDLDMEISLPIDDVPSYNSYDSLAKVVGESMRPKFHDGDILFIKHTNQVEVGEIAAFKVDGENFVKKLKKDNMGRYYLESLNDDYDDIFFDEDCTVETIGVVVDYWRE